MRSEKRGNSLLIPILIGSLTILSTTMAQARFENLRVQPAGGMSQLHDDTTTFWDVLVCEVIEEIPLAYPDTQACYLLKDVPPDRDVAYRVEFILPYATFSSTTTYQNTKPVAALQDSQYVLGNGFLKSGRVPHSGRTSGPIGFPPAIPNPYQPGNLIMTPPKDRHVVVYITPDFKAAEHQHAANPLFINFEMERNLIFQRVYFPNRQNPKTGRPFLSASDFDRMGYTLPHPIRCVDPRHLGKPVPCPKFNPLEDFPIIDVNVEELDFLEQRSPPPQPPATCPNRQRWDRPPLAQVHWAGPGSLNNTGENIPNPETTCTGYLITMLQWAGGQGTDPVPRLMMTRIATPPTFFDVSKLGTFDNPGTPVRFPDPPPDMHYVGIQNYADFGSDVRYNQQSRSVSEIIKWCPGKSGQECQEMETGFEWIFLHYTRPLERDDQETIKQWAEANDINEQQLGIWTADSRHPPFLIYRNKETSEAFQSQMPGGDVRANVPCFPAVNAEGQQQIWSDSPLSNAADGTNMGGYVPITVTCDIASPGSLSEAFLDKCLATLRATNPDWGPDGANCTQ